MPKITVVNEGNIVYEKSNLHKVNEVIQNNNKITNIHNKTIRINLKAIFMVSVFPYKNLLNKKTPPTELLIPLYSVKGVFILLIGFEIIQR